MRNRLAALERLQAVDSELDGLAARAARFPAQRAALQAEVTKAQEEADQERGRLADNERARRTLSTQLEADRDKVKKWETRLPNLKHPREFAALQREVEGQKRTNLQSEEELKRLSQEAGEIKAALAAKEAEAAARQAALADETHGTASQEQELEEGIARLTRSREEAKTQVDPQLLKTYERIRQRKPGPALIPASGGSCSACHRRLPPQTMNRLYVAGAIEPCPSCQRLVYVPPEPEGAHPG